MVVMTLWMAVHLQCRAGVVAQPPLGGSVAAGDCRVIQVRPGGAVAKGDDVAEGTDDGRRTGLKVIFRFNFL